MAELRLAFTEKDCEDLVSWLLDQSAWFVPEGPYDSDFYCVITNADDLHLWLLDSFPIFVCHDSFYRQQLEMTCTSGGIHKGKYFVNQREAGPALHFVSGVQANFLDHSMVYVSYISYWSRYWNPRVRDYEPASNELKQFFRRLSVFVRGCSLKLSVLGKTYWVGKHALRALKQGHELGTDETLSARKALDLLREQNSARRLESLLA